MINLKKLTLHSVKQIEFLGLVIDTKKMTLALSEKKLKHMSQQCQEFFMQPKSYKVNWPVAINCFEIFNRSKYLPYRKRVLQWLCDTGDFNPGGTPLVDGKLETLQREKNSASRTPYDHSDRCFNKMLGGILQGSFDGRK